MIDMRKIADVRITWNRDILFTWEDERELLGDIKRALEELPLPKKYINVSSTLYSEDSEDFEIIGD